MGFNEIRKFVQNVKRPRRFDILLNRKRHKTDIPERMMKNINDGTYSSRFGWQTKHILHPTLEKLLQDKNCLSAFHTFLQSEFSEENIEFWLACEDFKSVGSSDNLHCKAEEIYKEFIRPTASREINVDHHIRENIRKSLGEPSLSCFDEAQKHVYLLMERDSCQRFLLSDSYQCLTNKSRTMWYI